MKTIESEVQQSVEIHLSESFKQMSILLVLGEKGDDWVSFSSVLESIFWRNDNFFTQYPSFEDVLKKAKEFGEKTLKSKKKPRCTVKDYAIRECLMAKFSDAKNRLIIDGFVLSSEALSKDFHRPKTLLKINKEKGLDILERLRFLEPSQIEIAKTLPSNETVLTSYNRDPLLDKANIPCEEKTGSDGQIRYEYKFSSKERVYKDILHPRRDCVVKMSRTPFFVDLFSSHPLLVQSPFQEVTKKIISLVSISPSALLHAITRLKRCNNEFSRKIFDINRLYEECKIKLVCDDIDSFSDTWTGGLRLLTTCGEQHSIRYKLDLQVERTLAAGVLWEDWREHTVAPDVFVPVESMEFPHLEREEQKKSK